MTTTMASPPSDLSAQIYAVGSDIPLIAFQVCTSLVFGLAIICAFARSIMRFFTGRPIYWDDLFLALGVACLTTTAGLTYKNIYYFYMLSAIGIQPQLAYFIPPTELQYLLAQSLPMQSAAAGIAWGTIFCVKASFLIISKQLLQRLPWLNYYFWFVAGLTGLSAGFLISSPFIQCPYFGVESAKCAGDRQQTLYNIINGLIAGFDILTDILVASIPIIILWKSKLESKQKFIIGPVLSLSLVMIIFSSIRISKTRRMGKIDIVWLAFWQFLEAGIAVIVTSIVTLRTVFTAHKARKSQGMHSRTYGSSANKSKGSSRPMDTFGAEEDSHPMVTPPTYPKEHSQIMVQESWGVTYSSEPYSSEELTPPPRIAKAV